MKAHQDMGWSLFEAYLGWGSSDVLGGWKKISRKLGMFLAIHHPSEGLHGEEWLGGGRDTMTSVLNPVILMGFWDKNTEMS